MIPSVIASQIQYGIEDYLRTTFPPESVFFKDILERFFQDPRGIFRGPYLSLKLPYRPGTGENFFPEIPMKYPPYLHQERAFRRLGGEAPKSTIVATGTGSGKTECFMYPILDYCRRHRGEEGIKAIVIYPMNALATDQAKRFAREIDKNPALKGNVTVGLFIGGGDWRGGSSRMTAEGVITSKETMLENPPSILLTNYRMLDLLLLRPKDFRLWRRNDPDTLKFIAVDELHTFDGAQGSDLGSLLRRLYARLKADRDSLCAVGTSATLGDDEASRERILDFAQDLFGLAFDDESVITEDVLAPQEFLGESLVGMWPVPDQTKTEELSAMRYPDEAAYLAAGSRLWFPEEWALPPGEEADEESRVRLGEALCQHPFFQNLLRLVKDKPLDIDEMTALLAKVLPGITERPREYQTNLLDSIFSLISHARRAFDDNEGKTHYIPFLNVRCQLWLRELRRMAATVEKQPRLVFFDDIKPDHEIEALPLIHCRSCGRIGFLTVAAKSDERFSSDLREIYSAYFARSPKVHYIFHDDRPASEQPRPEEEQVQRKFKTYLCGHCLSVHEGEITACPDCGRDDAFIPVSVERPTERSGNRVEVTHDCPVCSGSETLSIVGARAASLISVAISQLFATQYNSDQKLLTFSDSVQDAAHRAVFYEARTFRFNLRAAIQQFISQLGEEVSLARLPERFCEYWIDRLGPERFIAQFIPPDLQNSRFDDFYALKKTGRLPADSPLLDLVSRRIHWEILSEYGFRARVGRTLEKTGCSIAALKSEPREGWIDDVFPRVQDRLREIDRGALRRLVLGIVRLMRVRGGISADYLKEYQRNGDTFALNNRSGFLPKFPYRRAPVFLQEKPALRRFDAAVGSGTKKTIYHRWLAKCLREGLLADRVSAAELFGDVLAAGVRRGILTEETTTKGEKVWGLNPEAFVIEKEVRQFVCDRTNHQVSVPQSEAEFWEGMPTQRFDSDTGRYRGKGAAPSDRENYYKNLYSRGKVHRVIARDHTGLLKREDREELENEFIAGESVAAVNTLSCTPTLEMGINVGDLSSVFLCSVPPTKSNYLQRIGRAGRRDGNAIHLVVANAQPHDLHFFHEPEEMFTSAVTPPGIFLNAPAVLQRQLTAYCFDRWIEQINGKKDAVAPTLKEALDAVESGDRTRFPYTFFTFIEQRRTELFDGFRGIFEDVLLPSTEESLREFFYGSESQGKVDVKILEGLDRTARARRACQKQLKTVSDKLRELNNKPKDKTRDELEKELVIEKNALAARRKAINEKQIFNFFTDEGLLPNYAFPETGVTLRSVLYRYNRKAAGQDDRYKVYPGEYERPPQSAISELAPGNEFYVQGRKLTINRIDMAATETEQWHFCDHCDYIEKSGDGEKHTACCPKCGSANWVDGNLKRKVLRLRRVIANQEESTTHFADDADQRDPKFYDSRMMLNFSRDEVTKAYKFSDEKIPFGFEYIGKVDFREFNFGEDFHHGDSELTIAGELVGGEGFRVCAECGMVQIGAEALRHHVSCKYDKSDDEKPIIHCAYLYREFTSEAIRILLPVDSFDSQVGIPSLKAAIYMGLREKYAGNVDHILITTQEVPVEDSTLRKRFLVLYDRVPGGTGYLKELAQSKENIVELLKLAYEKLKNCPCHSDPEKDGCYGCLYAYKTSRDMKRISAKAAMDILRPLVTQPEKFEQIKSIDDISVNALFDSDLEKMFIEAIRRRYSGKKGFSLEKRICDGRPGYLLTLPPAKGDEKPRCYEIVPQYEFGPQQGVSERFGSCADFLFRAVGNSAFKPIAVFTDGYAYHGDIASPDYRLPTDLVQRMAIVRTRKYLTWSLSWNDVFRACEDKPGDHFVPLVRPGELLHQETLPKELRDIPAEDAFRALARLLENPDLDAWRRVARMMILSIGGAAYCREETIEELQRLITEERDRKKLEEFFARGGGEKSGEYCLLKRHERSPSADSFYSVSFRFEDFEKIKPYLTMLNKEGYEFWYDNGIRTGDEWQGVIASNLANSDCVM
ncbi:MAG: DEAD/DEAH box helicase, partial [Thermoguttaceae bacterium]|nr:DEAD/DEAH box helicase [Thermoguttaceae bacterium]